MLNLIATTLTITVLLQVQPIVPTTPPPTDDRWVSYPGNPDLAPGRGRRVVFVAGDEEYRSEECLPMLARMFASNGFETIVLFSQDAETGEIDPENRTHIPGLALIDDADLLVLQLRFRDLPDTEMKHIVDYVQSGRPVTGIRTSTHAFAIPDERESAYSDWSWNNNGGFGRTVLGETWVAHHGGHGREATRGVIEPGQESHAVLRGVDDVFGPTDVYAVRSLPADTTVLLRGAILEGMQPTDMAVMDKRETTQCIRLPGSVSERLTRERHNVSLSRRWEQPKTGPARICDDYYSTLRFGNYWTPLRFLPRAYIRRSSAAGNQLRMVW